MIFKGLLLGILVLLINTGCMSQNISKRDFKKSFHSLNLTFINQKSFNDSRDLLFDQLTDLYFQSDTIILVESFTDETGRYSCGVYSSNDSLTQCFYVENNFQGRQINHKLIKTNSCGLFTYIISSINENKLEEMVNL